MFPMKQCFLLTGFSRGPDKMTYVNHMDHYPVPQGLLLCTESIVAVISFSFSPFIFTSFCFLFCLFTLFQNDVNGVGNLYPFFPSLSILGLRKPVIFFPNLLAIGVAMWQWQKSKDFEGHIWNPHKKEDITKRHHWFLPVASFLDWANRYSSHS